MQNSKNLSRGIPEDPTPWVRSVVYPLLERGAFATSDVALTRHLREIVGRSM